MVGLVNIYYWFSDELISDAHSIGYWLNLVKPMAEMVNFRR